MDGNRSARTPGKSGGGRAAHFLVSGVVQGVGFRPFVYRLARELRISGWVKNAGRGVEIRIEASDRKTIEDFAVSLERCQPPLSKIEKIVRRKVPFRGLKDFKIRKTRREVGFVFISPDIAVCKDCLKEIRTPGERRYHYAFTNCTNCGPRYTIVSDLPYDRASTTMTGFRMCPACRREYGDPLDRRYHAQPIACPDCGPRLRLVDGKTGSALSGDIPEAAALIEKGKILAVKGIGGFHLVCDPRNAAAVARLRRIKARERKPLALMAADIAAVERLAVVSPAERKFLLSPQRPIVLLREKKTLAGIAPHLGEVGVMLPYAPLHEMLLDHLELIVATSSNLRDAPIMKTEEEGLGRLCDVILTHDRPIAMRSDDSVLKIAGKKPLFVRRARGYVPYPQAVPDKMRTNTVIAALGGELKDTISIYKDGYVVTSQFLGDLDDYRNFGYFRETLAHLERLFGAKPEVLVTDLHPNFHTTRYAERSGLRHLKIQHHHAHALAPLLEHGIPPGRKILGVSLDGFGYGPGGKAWGGEFLIADHEAYRRFAHFEEVPLPGGDLASRQPWRMALAYLWSVYGDAPPRIDRLEAAGRKNIRSVLEMMNKGVRSPLSSSCGRLFDAVSFLCGTAPLVQDYEAEAAMRLEAATGREILQGYPYRLLDDASPIRVSFAPVIRGVVEDIRRGSSPALPAAKFHNTLARIVADLAGRARKTHGIRTVTLSGGCFLNRRLLLETERRLAGKGFEVLRTEMYSPNDESISLGQMAHGLAVLRRERG